MTNLIIVVAMANNFLVQKNIQIVTSLVEENIKEIIQNINKKAQKNNCEILIPEDCMVGTRRDGTGKVKNFDTIKDD